MIIWPFNGSNSGGAYQALPLSGPNALYTSKQSWRQVILARPRIVVGAVAGAVLLLTLYGVSSSFETVTTPVESAPVQLAPTSTGSAAPKSTLSPLFRELKEAEAKLPQHNLSLPFPEGKNG